MHVLLNVSRGLPVCSITPRLNSSCRHSSSDVTVTLPGKPYSAGAGLPERHKSRSASRASRLRSDSLRLVAADGARIILGDREQAARRLRRFLDVYPQIVANHADGFAYADLRYTNGFAVRWTPPAAPTSTDKGAPRT